MACPRECLATVVGQGINGRQDDVEVNTAAWRISDNAYRINSSKLQYSLVREPSDYDRGGGLTHTTGQTKTKSKHVFPSSRFSYAPILRNSGLLLLCFCFV